VFVIEIKSYGKMFPQTRKLKLFSLFRALMCRRQGFAGEKFMKLEATLDKLHEKATANRWLQIFTAFTRVLLAVGFIPASIPKILHKPFTVLPDSNPVGHYFNALYETGFYYEFIGWTQITAAILLLFPRTAHIGSLMFLPIIINIAVLTNSIGFKGTWLLTILMLLAASYLVAWDYDRLKPIFFGKHKYNSSFLPSIQELPIYINLRGRFMHFSSLFRLFSG
jgi:uncharacterized membrane protein YphA (DoxX/SURF4 family)